MAKAREPKVFRSMDDLPLMLTPYDLMDFLGKGQRQTYELNRVSKSTGRKPSLWVPGSGSGSNFSYNPGAKTGMKLSGRFVPGQHMFEKSLPDTKEDLRKITKSEVERLFRALF